MRNVSLTLERKHAERLNPLEHVGDVDDLHAVAVGVNVVGNIVARSFLDDNSVVHNFNGRADFHGVKQFLNVALVHANATVGNVAADTFGTIGAVNAVVAPNLHPTIAQRIFGTGRHFVFGIGRINPRRINFLAVNFVVARRRRRAHFAQAEAVDRNLSVAVEKLHQTACGVDDDFFARRLRGSSERVQNDSRAQNDCREKFCNAHQTSSLPKKFFANISAVSEKK